MTADESALGSFTAKWREAYPEVALALAFLPAGSRRARTAFGSLVHEFEQAAFQIREARVAVAKFDWWAGELQRMRSGDPRHPLTRALGEECAESVTAAQWVAVVQGALAQRDDAPAREFTDLLARYDSLYRPLTEIETRLFPGSEVARAARLQALGRALRECAMPAGALAAGRLPLPLRLLARHQLARGDLATSGERRTAALREHLLAIGSEFAAQLRDPAGLDPLHRARGAADHARSRRGARAVDPLASLQAGLPRLPPSTVWQIWRAARRWRG